MREKYAVQLGISKRNKNGEQTSHTQERDKDNDDEADYHAEAKVYFEHYVIF